MDWVVDTEQTIGVHRGWIQVLDQAGEVLFDTLLDDPEHTRRCDRAGAFWRATDLDGWMGHAHVIPPHASNRANPPKHVEVILRGEWEEHVFRLHPLARVETLSREAEWLAQEQRRIAGQLDCAVTQARRSNASWAAIGGAVGTSKQAAWERWGRDRS